MTTLSRSPQSELLEELRSRIESKTALVGIIGLGYVGLPLARAFADRGMAVLGFDVDASKVAKLQRGESYIGHINDESIATMRGQGFDATDRFLRLDEPDVIIICVPTPLTDARDPDLTYVVKSAEAIAERLRPGQLVVLESTTYPGTTRDVVLPIMEAKGLQAGRDFFLAFSPEREDPGNPNFSAPTIPKVVGGLDPASLELAVALYSQVVVQVVPVSSPEVAEACKILENTYRAVNIALVNELKVLFDRMGINVWEVIEAAKTKPFGFQAFYPGPGLGGHCLAGSETVRVRGRSLDTVLPLADLFERCQGSSPSMRLGDTEVIDGPDLETLSIDPHTGATSWQPVAFLFRRRFQGTMIELELAGNRRLRVTDRHPMLVIEHNRLVVRHARDLQPGDQLPQFNGGVVGKAGIEADPKIDLLSVLPSHVIEVLHTRIQDVPWSQHESLLKTRYGWTIRDSVRLNSLAARRFLEIESELGIDREAVVLLKGKGNSHTSFPAVLRLTPDFCRLIGYYLSEGCITEERGNPRVRFTFHREEEDYIRDVESLLATVGVSTAPHHDKTWRSTTLRAGSSLLGHLFRDVLEAGVNSGTMRIPHLVMGASARHHAEVLAGLLRGDGDVEVHIGTRSYRKNGREYCHAFNSGRAGYFSSSPELLAQVEILLQGLGFQPSRKRGMPQLNLSGRENLKLVAGLLTGAKAQRLEQLEAAKIRHVSTRLMGRWAGGTKLAVVRATAVPADEPVYSLEVPGTHTFATTGGVFVHNCIPVDPFYLTWVARKHGLSTRFIELAGEVNTAMPAYVVGKVADALNEHGKPVKGSKITLLGMAYKKDVDDPRESPGFELMDLLLHKGAMVQYNDPHIPVLPPMRHYPHLRMASQDLTAEYLARQDCLLIVTDHSAYNWQWIVEHAPLIVDTRNALRGMDLPPGRVVRA